MTQQYSDYAGCIKNGKKGHYEVISFHYFCNVFLLINVFWNLHIQR